MYLQLLDWRRRIADSSAVLRPCAPDAATLDWFRSAKDALFREHPQSPLPAAERPDFKGLAYWPFDPAARLEARFVVVATEPPPGQGGEIAFSRVGRLDFEFHGQP